MDKTFGQSLTLDDIVHRYGGALAVDHVTLEIAAGELVALLGPSGCGKTTLLRIIAGFIQQSGGKVVVGGRRIDELPPARRNIGIVFQNYALFPHMTVQENVAYGLAARGTEFGGFERFPLETVCVLPRCSFARQFWRMRKPLATLFKGKMPGPVLTVLGYGELPAPGASGRYRAFRHPIVAANLHAAAQAPLDLHTVDPLLWRWLTLTFR
ncbi:ATP-binding cassette domain-containing protein [Paracidovorax oryzae]|uniref:ATP-binding cassette domain-containing protein n=1 Tax=Paracidovorax oryzae TaxID=862720 RepID=UPI0002F3B4B3|nr:ABC transporter ATP-binding protein [Paracidovorax oryzae]